MFGSGRAGLDFPQVPGLHEQIVARIDEAMIPVVEPDERTNLHKGRRYHGGKRRFRWHAAR